MPLLTYIDHRYLELFDPLHMKWSTVTPRDDFFRLELSGWAALKANLCCCKKTNWKEIEIVCENFDAVENRTAFIALSRFPKVSFDLSCKISDGNYDLKEYCERMSEFGRSRRPVCFEPLKVIQVSTDEMSRIFSHIIEYEYLKTFLKVSKKAQAIFDFYENAFDTSLKYAASQIENIKDIDLAVLAFVQKFSEESEKTIFTESFTKKEFAELVITLGPKLGFLIGTQQSNILELLTHLSFGRWPSKDSRVLQIQEVCVDKLAHIKPLVQKILLSEGFEKALRAHFIASLD